MNRLGKKDSGCGSILFGLILMFPFACIMGGRVYTQVVFDINCGERIKRAADANTVELARTELEAVIAYAEQKGYTQGYTSVLWETPSEDVGFWYNNIKTALNELKALPPHATPLEKSNMLIKLRETLIDHNKDGDGDTITVPSGISRYPNNIGWFIGSWLTALLASVGFCVWFVGLSKKSV